MEESKKLLSELNIDEEFKKIVIKVIDSIESLFAYAVTEQNENHISAMMDLADMYIAIIHDSYKNNQNYQLLIKFLKGEVKSCREYSSKDFDINFISSTKPKYYQ